MQGLVSKRTNKLEHPEVKTVFENNDLLLLTETWTSVHSELDLNVDGFDFIPLHRTERKR